MRQPAKDEAALLKRVGEAIRKSVIQPGCCMEDTGCQIGPCGCSQEAGKAAIAAIRAAGWAAVPQAELDALRAENARLRASPTSLKTAYAEKIIEIYNNTPIMRDLALKKKAKP
jgi:hypothetical protein